MITNCMKGKIKKDLPDEKLERMTVQRQVIMEEMGKLHTHPTADEVYQVVRKRLPRVSLGTVYRNLEKLADHGLLLRLDSGSGPRRYDARVENHYHIRCLECSRVGDIFSNQPYPVPEELPGTDFDVIGLKVEYFGICPACRKKASKHKK